MLRATARRSLATTKFNARRWVSTSAPCHAVPAVATTQTSQAGFMAWLLGDKPGSNVPPLFEALPNVKLPPPLPDKLDAVPTEITTLPNGLKIASENTMGSTVTVGLYVDAGSINESEATSGAAHVLERMAFKSTTNRSHFRLIREVEAIGGNLMATGSREQMAYTGDAIKTHMPEIVEILVDSVRNPVFYEWEVKEQVSKIRAELPEIMNNGQAVVSEALQTAGFQGGLAKPMVATESALARISADALAAFVQDNYTAPRMVLAASGVDHKDLLEIAEPLLGDMPSMMGPDEAPISKYIGGDWRGVADIPKTHIGIAFEAPGGWRNEKDSITLTVMQMLLGGGGSFSAGGPGKGMYSRLYTRVLNKYSDVDSIAAFSQIYNDTGLFGIHGCSDPEFSSNLVNILCNELIDLVSGMVTETELHRAKNATVSSVLMNLESRVIVTEDIGRQILTYGHRKPVESFIDQVKRLTVEDVQKTAAKILSTPLTMASYGNVSHVPRYEEIVGRFK